MLRKNVIGIVILCLQLAASVAFTLILGRLNVLSTKLTAVIIGVIALLFVFALLSQFFKSGRIVGKVFSVLVTLVLVIGSLFLNKTYTTLTKVSSGSTEIAVQEAHMAFLVMKDSPVTGQQDLNGRVIGLLKTQDRDLSDQTVSELNGKLTTAATAAPYENPQQLVTALYDGSVDCIVLNEALRPLIIENIKPNFDEETRVLDTYKVRQPLGTNADQTAGETSDAEMDTKKEQQNSFTVYLSGNDSYGEVTLDGGRSDVNIIATVNPNTHTILLTTTPRDYYVPLCFGQGEGGTDEYRDKLTHAGVYGIDCSMATLENVYGVKLDYYARVNFSRFKNIIDVLGGIDVDSQYAFSAGIYSFSEGINHLDGDQALTFARERHAFADGDFQRGRNQMQVIKAMADKILSPAVLPNFMPLMDQVSDSILTDIPKDTITGLVKNQLSDNAKWTILTEEVSGTAASAYSYTMGINLSMVIPDQEAVDKASDAMRKVLEGTSVSQP